MGSKDGSLDGASDDKSSLTIFHVEFEVGCEDGSLDGKFDEESSLTTFHVGTALGSSDGCSDGDDDGSFVGNATGILVGTNFDLAMGLAVGTLLLVGAIVG